MKIHDIVILDKPTDAEVSVLVKDHLTNKLGKGEIKTIFTSIDGKHVAIFPEIKGRDADHCGAMSEDGYMDINIEELLVFKFVEPTETLSGLLADSKIRRVSIYTQFQRAKRWSKNG